MKALKRNTSITARALEFTILTASRTSEVLKAKWSEMDRVEGMWVIPAERMKANREHRVPLGPRAHEITSYLDDHAFTSDWAFPGAKEGRPLSSMAMLELLRGMKPGVTWSLPKHYGAIGNWQKTSDQSRESFGGDGCCLVLCNHIIDVLSFRRQSRAFAAHDL